MTIWETRRKKRLSVGLNVCLLVPMRVHALMGKMLLFHWSIQTAFVSRRDGRPLESKWCVRNLFKGEQL